MDSLGKSIWRKSISEALLALKCMVSRIFVSNRCYQCWKSFQTWVRLQKEGRVALSCRSIFSARGRNTTKRAGSACPECARLIMVHRRPCLYMFTGLQSQCSMGSPVGAPERAAGLRAVQRPTCSSSRLSSAALSCASSVVISSCSSSIFLPCTHKQLRIHLIAEFGIQAQGKPDLGFGTVLTMNMLNQVSMTSPYLLPP